MNESYHNTLASLKRSMIGSEALQVIQLLLDRLSNRRSISILDVGSGDFSNILLVASYFTASGITCKIDTVDLYYPNLNTYIPEDIVLNKFTGDFMELDFEEKYDLVYSRHSLYYLGDFSKAISKMKVLLADDGIITVIAWDKACVFRQLSIHIDDDNIASYIEMAFLLKLGNDLGLITEGINYRSSIDLSGYTHSNASLEALATFVIRSKLPKNFDIKTFKGKVEELSMNASRENAIVFYKLK